MNTRGLFEIILRSYTDETHTSSGDIQWLIEDTPECIVIAFRGTELNRAHYLPDIFRNLLAIVPWYNKTIGCWGSYGYMAAALTAVTDIYDFLELRGHIDKPIILAGHSMGASISYMVARIMDTEGVPVKFWVGAGTTNCIIRQTLPNFTCLNFRYEEDIISIFPPKFLGFTQPSLYFQIGHDDSNGIRIGDLSDHRMTNYLLHVPLFDIIPPL